MQNISTADGEVWNYAGAVAVASASEAATDEFVRSGTIRRLYILTLTAVGMLFGFLYAQQAIAHAVARMRAQWGWVCGTGLDFPIYLFTPAGGLAGCIIATLTWHLAAHYRSRNRV